MMRKRYFSWRDRISATNNGASGTAVMGRTKWPGIYSIEGLREFCEFGNFE